MTGFDGGVWRSIRGDFESLPADEWSLIWSSRPPVWIAAPIQLPSQWTWFHPMDKSLRARASAIFAKAAKARGYDDEDDWLDEIRHADFVRFQLSASVTDKMPDGTFVECRSGVLKRVVDHSITLCHQLEAGCAPKPIIGRLTKAAKARISQSTASFMKEFGPKLEQEHHKVGTIWDTELIREVVVHQFNFAARECMSLFDSVDDFEAELRTGIANFVRHGLSEIEWLAGSAEVAMGFSFLSLNADPWAGIPEPERASVWRVGAITGEALADAAINLISEAKARAGGGSLSEKCGVTEPSADEHCTESVSTANGEKANRQAQKRGPKADYQYAARLAEIVARVAPNGDWRSRLDEICDALDAARDDEGERCIPCPKMWRKRDKACKLWSDQLDRPKLIKVIEYRLETANQRKKAVPETFS